MCLAQLSAILVQPGAGKPVCIGFACIAGALSTHSPDYVFMSW